MITEKEYKKAKRRMLRYLRKLKIKLTDEEKERIEVADFGLPI